LESKAITMTEKRSTKMQWKIDCVNDPLKRSFNPTLNLWRGCFLTTDIYLSYFKDYPRKHSRRHLADSGVAQWPPPTSWAFRPPPWSATSSCTCRQSGLNVIKLFLVVIYGFRNKLEGLSLASFSSLV
jgi:hypothetical protein